MSNLQWVKELNTFFKDLIAMAKDGHKLNVSNGVHQEFLSENMAVLSCAAAFQNKYLSESPPSIEGEEKVQECKSPSGIVVGLIDSLIAISNVLVTDDFLYQDGIEDALADLRASDNMKRLMNIGELEDAKAYIREKQKEIDSLLSIIALSKKESPSPALPIKEEEKTLGQILKEAPKNEALTTGKEDLLLIQTELLELTIKAGRRLMHDFHHLLSEVPDDNQFKEVYTKRAAMWKGIFYPDDGPKNYRASLHYEISNLEMENSRLKALLKKHGIDPNEDHPF
jgi:hypothetical protein